MNKVYKKQDDKKIEYIIASIDPKSDYLYITTEDNIVIQADSYSDIGSRVTEAITSTYENVIEIKTTIITEYFLIIEITREKD